METKDLRADLSTGEVCPECAEDLLLVTSDNDSVSVRCLCSEASVLVAV